MTIFSLKITLVFLLHILLIILVLSNGEPQDLVGKTSLNYKVSTILVFGDSTSDPGNNNYILTPFKGNFPPYGRDFANQKPTGRFTNGLLTSDIVARYLGVKDNVPPYLDPSLTIHDLMTGVSFASAGSGYDPLTPTISVACEAWIRKGDPQEKICSEVKRVQPDLLVVGSRGLGPFQRVFVGTVSEFCVKHSECPVVTIKRTPEETPQDPVDD